MIAQDVLARVDELLDDLFRIGVKPRHPTDEARHDDEDVGIGGMGRANDGEEDWRLRSGLAHASQSLEIFGEDKFFRVDGEKRNGDLSGPWL